MLWFLSARCLLRDVALVVALRGCVVRDVLRPERDVVRADGDRRPGRRGARRRPGPGPRRPPPAPPSARRDRAGPAAGRRRPRAAAVWLASRGAVALLVLASAPAAGRCPGRRCAGLPVPLGPLGRRAVPQGRAVRLRRLPAGTTRTAGSRRSSPASRWCWPPCTGVVPDWTAAGLLVSLVAGRGRRGRAGPARRAGRACPAAAPCSRWCCRRTPCSWPPATARRCSSRSRCPAGCARAGATGRLPGCSSPAPRPVRVTGLFLAARAGRALRRDRRAGSGPTPPGCSRRSRCWPATPPTCTRSPATGCAGRTRSRRAGAASSTAPVGGARTTLRRGRRAGPAPREYAWSFGPSSLAVARRRRCSPSCCCAGAPLGRGDVRRPVGRLALATSTYYLSVARATLLWFPLWLLLAEAGAAAAVAAHGVRRGRRAADGGGGADLHRRALGGLSGWLSRQVPAQEGDVGRLALDPAGVSQTTGAPAARHDLERAASRLDLAVAEVGVPVGAGAEGVARVVAVHEVDAAGDRQHPLDDGRPAPRRRRARGRCPGRTRRPRSRPTASHSRAIASSRRAIAKSPPAVFSTSTGSGHSIRSNVLTQFVDADRRVLALGDVPAVHDQPLGAGAGRRRGVVGQDLARRDADACCWATPRSRCTARGRRGRRPPPRALEALGHDRGLPALRVAEEGLHEVGVARPRLAEQVGRGDVGTDAQHPATLRRASGAGRRGSRPVGPGAARAGRRADCPPAGRASPAGSGRPLASPAQRLCRTL